MKDEKSQSHELKGMALVTRDHPFHNLIGMTLEPTEDDSIRVRFSMRPDLCGHPGILYGGIISCVIDIIGGAIVTWNQIKDIRDHSMEEQIKKLSGIRTIDLRIDYLRPGKGKEFTVTGSILRDGKKVIVVRMELKNDEQSLIATGIGTFMVG
jgi:uncharacterized protein (TIGR00369 family)